MIVELLVFGDELLDGRRTDTNSTWLGHRFASLGVVPRFGQKARDRRNEIADAFRLALSRSDLILSTGGLGPTADDMTFEALADAVGKPLTFRPEIWAGIEKRFRDRGLSCPESNRRQAMLPEGSVPFSNEWGTAPGLRLEVDGKVIYSLPGVPLEMENLFVHFIEPEIEKRLGGEAQRTARTFHFSGVPESHLEERLEKRGIRRLASDMEVAYTASFPVIDVTLAVSLPSKEAVGVLDRAEKELRTEFGDRLIGVGEETLEERVVSELAKRKLKLRLAESITGGLIAGKIVNVAGSSEVFDRGVVTYSNASKVELLGVSKETLDRVGAVSSDCALEMARGARGGESSCVAVAVTGIAGPEGGTADKPVGLTYVAWVGPGFEEVKRYQFRWDRNRNRMLATYEALQGLVRLVAGPTEEK